MKVTKALRLAVIAGLLLATGDAVTAFENPFQKLRRDMREATSNLKRLRVPSSIGRIARPAPAAPEAAPPTATEAADAETAEAKPVEAATGKKEPAPVVSAAIPSPRIRPMTEDTQPIAQPVLAAREPAPKKEREVKSEPKVAMDEPTKPVVLPHLRPKIASLAPVGSSKTSGKPAKAGPRLATLPPVDGRDTVAECSRSLASLGITAVPLAPIREGTCGVASPAAVAALGGGAIQFTEKAIVNCAVAGALASWMHDKVEPAAKSILRGNVTALRIAASYDCRGRNRDAKAQLSEHAFGNAIDISAFKIEGRGWIEVGKAGGDDERFLAEIREAACGPFTTVLGPGVAMHDEHFHLDLAKRGKKGRALYCR
jgi:hypothetical protein